VAGLAREAGGVRPATPSSGTDASTRSAGGGRGVRGAQCRARPVFCCARSRSSWLLRARSTESTPVGSTGSATTEQASRLAASTASRTAKFSPLTLTGEMTWAASPTSSRPGSLRRRVVPSLRVEAAATWSPPPTTTYERERDSPVRVTERGPGGGGHASVLWHQLPPVPWRSGRRSGR
jgi:hypothetical protein